MAMESTFRVDIFGDSVFGRKFPDLTSSALTSLRKLDPEVEVKEHHFARIGYRAEFYGTPVHFDVVDNVQAKLLRIAKTYLVKWKVKFTISYREAG